MGSGALGLQTMQNEFSTARMRAVWNDEERLRKICLVERTVAQVQAEQGMIPTEAAQKIQEICRYESIHMRKLYVSAAKAGHFLAGFVQYMKGLLGKEGEFIHYGMASQDILDTAMMLQLRDAHQIVVESLRKIGRELVRIATEHKHTVAVGRGHGGHSPSTTIGFRAVVILNELDRYLTRLQEVESFIFTGVIGGVVGTQAALGQQGAVIEAEVLQRLNLSVPEVYWHTQRDRFVEYGHIMTMVSGMLQKLGQDLFDLSRGEIQEYAEPYFEGRQASTVLPTKRNPYLCEAVVNLGNLVQNQMSLLYQAQRVMHEKDTIAWRNIWVALPEMCMYLSAQLNYSYTLLHQGTFQLDQIEKNLYLDGGMKMSERLMMALAPHIGKQSAHQLMYEIANQARIDQVTFNEAVSQNERIQQYYTSDELAQLLDPHTYIGAAVEKTEHILKLFAQRHPEI
ncbi:class-II fumarase/aspartase family protein [Candidatus Enterococcus willemsii]|uniref:Adenylosuccinate lyase C-terminal domain-containing protein n=1 Tax=Candidatus Enterococcus willemsii TaxID=1857215 RepID=A0ABQ6Z0W8_9ENTE|nr:adenylosuccinate lyase family protein [Enterococcus sp. CU12B]KAF1304954.1 hypothetical protein BAU17_13535 [Enterococcus sp. CU12B]